MKGKKENKLVEEIEVNNEMVVAAATNINEVLKPDPLLDLKKPGEELQKDVEELFEDIVEDDKLESETWKTLKALGWKKVIKSTEVEKSAPIKAKKTSKEKKEHNITRTEALAKVLSSKPQTKEDLASQIEMIVTKAGGSKNPDQSFRCVASNLPILIACNFVNIDEQGKIRKI